jgi:probable blue pigment (indigoidine) exporter
MRQQLALVATTALAPSLWGSTYVVTTELLPPGRPVTAATLRALPVGLLLLLVIRSLPEREWLWRVGVLGLLNCGFFFPLLFLAAYRLPGGVSATVGAIGPLVVAALSAGLLERRPPGLAYVAGATGVAGVALLVLRGDAAVDLVGVGAAGLAALSLSLGTVLAKRWGSPDSPVAFATWQLVAGGVFLVPLALVLEGVPARPDLGGSLGYLHLGLLGTGLAYVLWFRGLARMSATSMSFLVLVSPVSATLLGLVVLGQSLTWLQALGALLVLGSAIAGQATRTPRVPRLHGLPALPARRRLRRGAHGHSGEPASVLLPTRRHSRARSSCCSATS